jgi:surface carbohydrate biosynthesis protein
MSDMQTQEFTLLIPVENQVRELDPKLLLACLATRHGFRSIIGFRREMHFHVTSFPRGIYLSKSVTAASELMFGIMRKFGHEIVAWDEEALVHLPPEIYYSRRLSPKAIGLTSRLFAWGEDNAVMWCQYPMLPPGKPIHVTGNPRNDMLRAELRAFYRPEVERIHETHRDFILINTNFNHVNAFSAVQNLFRPTGRPGEAPKFGRAAKGMTREYALGLRDLKQAIFEAFQTLIPELENAFPQYNIVVRPHPTENQTVYHQIASRCQRVHVTNEGNVVPWLMAAKALVHNGCTTGVEAYAMGVPAVSYRAVVNEHYDYGFFKLPNLLSHQCFNRQELLSTIGKILAGDLGAADGSDRKALVDQHLAAIEGPMACERIVTVLAEMSTCRNEAYPVGFGNRLHARSLAAARKLVKRTKAYMPGSHNKPAFQRHRYPPISLAEMRARVARFQKILGHMPEIVVQPIFNQFFQISAG